MTTLQEHFRNTLRDLVILSESASPWLLDNWREIFGDFQEVFKKTKAPYSEYDIVDFSSVSKTIRLMGYLTDVWLPHLTLRRQKEIVLLNAPKLNVYHLDINGSKITTADQQAKPHEQWFFINGVATNELIAEWNGKRIVDLFRRPLTVLHNPTDTLPFDLLECVFDRTFDLHSNPAHDAAKKITRALQNNKKVVVITHSQGGIIISAALNLMLKENGPFYHQCKDHLSKFEIYTFACPADEMLTITNVIKHRPKPWPRLEHFANINDLVAKLGILRVVNRKHQLDKKIPLSLIAIMYHELDLRLDHIDILGQIYLRDSYGHLLNAHYLDAFEDKPYETMDEKNKNRSGKSKVSKNRAEARLYKYLGGKSPR